MTACKGSLLPPKRTTDIHGEEWGICRSCGRWHSMSLVFIGVLKPHSDKSAGELMAVGVRKEFRKVGLVARTPSASLAGSKPAEQNGSATRGMLRLTEGG